MHKIAFSNAINLLSCAKAGFLLLLVSTFFFSTCSDDKQKVDTLLKETETLHDEAMKDMAAMNRVARELKQTMIAATMLPEQSAAYDAALTAMGQAENEMMEWMKNYQSPDEMPPAEALKYLQEQKSKIEKNRSDIKAALAAGLKLQGK